MTLYYKQEVVFEVLTAASTKMAVFYVVTPVVWYNFTNISEVLAASIIRAKAAKNSGMLVNLYQTTQR
jgi:hypothetical protein